ncbi:unnamed protein product [Rotaria sp. Silwood1]|nr:unnamed protein product [Rotaria sp. Silwood1]
MDTISACVDDYDGSSVPELFDAPCHYSQNARSTCPQLTDFTLFESSIQFVIDDMKSILAYMKNLVKLTLSIHDTFDSLFCHGPTIESILNEYLPHLLQFHYTITHQIAKQILIEDFVRWPMNVTYYGIEHCKWIHIYSLPWPSNKNDKRHLPIVRVGSNTSVSSDVKKSAHRKYVTITKDHKFSLLNTKLNHVCEIISSVLISIKLPFRIYKVIFSINTPIFSTNSIIQPSVHHLIIKRCLYNRNEMSILAHQFPCVKYLKLDLPLDKCSFIDCLNIVRNREDNIQQKSYYWTELVCFSTQLCDLHKHIISNESQLYDWFIQYINLTYHKNSIKDGRVSTLTIWY